MSKLEYTQFMGAGTEGLGSLENAGVVALLPVDQLKSRISKDKQEAHDRFSLHTDTGGWLSPNRVIGDTLDLSSFYVGEQPDGVRVVFGVAPKVRINRDEEVPIEVLQAIDYARRLGLLQAISKAEKAGQISMLTALKQSAGVLGPGYKEMMQAGGERFLSDQGIGPETAIGILKEQRLKGVGLPAKIQEVGGVTGSGIVAKRGGDTELQENVWQIPEEASAKLAKGTRRINKVLYPTAAGLVVGTLTLAACGPVSSGTPIPPTRQGSDTGLPTPVVEITQGGAEESPTSPNANPTETNGNYGLATQTAEWPGVGVNVVELASGLYESGELSLANDIQKDGDEWKSIEGQGGDINGLLTAIQAELRKQGNANATVNAVQGETGGWAFEVRAGDGTLMWSVVDDEANATKSWQQHPNRITEGSHFEKLDPKEIGLKDGERIELAIDQGTSMGVVVDSDGQIKGVFDPLTATVSRFIAEAEPTPTQPAWVEILPVGASNPHEVDGRIVATNASGNETWYYDTEIGLWKMDVLKIYAEAGVEFPDNYETHLEKDYGEFNLRLSEELFGRFNLPVVHLPDDVAERMYLHSMGRYMYWARWLDEDRYSGFFDLAEKVKQDQLDNDRRLYADWPEFRELAEKTLKEGPVPLNFRPKPSRETYDWNDDIRFANNLNINFVTKEEYFRLLESLDKNQIAYYSAGTEGSEAEQLDIKTTVFVNGQEIELVSYDIGWTWVPIVGPGADPRKWQGTPPEKLSQGLDKMWYYSSLINFYRQSLVYSQWNLLNPKIALTFEDNYGDYYRDVEVDRFYTENGCGINVLEGREKTVCDALAKSVFTP